MFLISNCNLQDTIGIYAVDELKRLLNMLCSAPVTNIKIELSKDTSLNKDEISLVSGNNTVCISGGSSRAVLHCVYTFLEKLGCVFESSGELLPAPRNQLKIPDISLREIPGIAERGIRMHLNFVQDQSFFSETEFASFIDNMARQRFNYLLFHMYTPQQWFPFSYRGIKHLDLQLGNLNREHLSDEMIGREKVQVQDHWFPEEFESITDREELLNAMYKRFKKMMKRAGERGITNCVAFEPEALPPAIIEKLPEWTGTSAEDLMANEDFGNNWQEAWSGVKLDEPEIRHPLIIDVAVERCLQCIDAFPDMHELQLISREGTTWRPKADESYEEEIDRLKKKFKLKDGLFDLDALAKTVPPDDGPEMNAKAHPYWTVLPGDNFYPSVIGALRYTEFAMVILADKRVVEKLKKRNIKASISIYNPNPESIRQIMPIIAKMIPAGNRFHCLADYGATDIAANLPAWKPLRDAGIDLGVVSWLEFDGTMMLAQGWNNSIIDNVKAADKLDAGTMYFNHWRVRSLEHNSAAAAALSWNPELSRSEFENDYFGRLFGVNSVAKAIGAYGILEAGTIYSKNYTYNIGFTGQWVYKNSTNIPGYDWKRLLKAKSFFDKASDSFQELSEISIDTGKEQAQYMADICRISALHIQAVYHLQNAKLPLFGYKAWPLGNEHACWPPPEKLKDLVNEAELALELEMEYMKIYSKWVKSCDEQGQLCLQQIGVVEPFTEFVKTLTKQFEFENTTNFAKN
jgi:hypothetical protein